EVIPPEYRIETYKQQAEGGKPIEERLLVKKKADLGGNHVSQAAAGYGQEGWEVTLRFDTEGAKVFGQITEANVNHRFAIVLDGVIQSAPVIRTAIYGGNAVISGGRMDEPEARNLASVLENPLQTPVKIEEERQVSASLGSDSIKSGIYSGIAGFILVVVFMIIYYRLVGLIADIALRSEEHTSELQSLAYLVCRLLLEKKKIAPVPPHGNHVREDLVCSHADVKGANEPPHRLMLHCVTPRPRLGGPPFPFVLDRPLATG